MYDLNLNIGDSIDVDYEVLPEDTFDKNVVDAQGLAFYANIIERDGAGDYGRNSGENVVQ